MRSIFNFFFKKSDEQRNSFFVYEDLPNEQEHQNEHPKTVFEQIVMRKKSEEKHFKYRYAVITAIAVVLSVVVIVLASYLSIYKQNSPFALCEQITDAFDENNPEIFIKHCTNLPKVLKNDKNLKEYFKSYLPRNTFKFYELASDNKKEQKFIFKSGDAKIGEIVFKKSDKKAAFGIDRYNVKSFKLEPLTEYRYTVYSTFKLVINGEAADKYLFSKNSTLDNLADVTDAPITRDMYIIDDVNYVKDIKALDSDGQLYEVVSTISNFGYDITIKCDERKDEIGEFLKSFVFDYMHYMVKDDSKPQTVLEYLHESSYLCDIVKKYINWDITRYENERIEKFELSELVYYGSGYYTCRVSADYVTEVKNETVAKGFNKQIYLTFSNGKYYIVDMIDATES